MVELDTMYLDWLYSKVSTNDRMTPTQRYYDLMRMLHTTEFVWQVVGDDNRAEDGTDLRREFLLVADIPGRPEWLTSDGCSMLEMFIALSRRAQFDTDVPAVDWFWEFMDNLGLKAFNDGNWPGDDRVSDILDTFNWRRYHADGRGGAFPIEHPCHDQREVEIWYQFCEYLEDQNRLL